MQKDTITLGALFKFEDDKYLVTVPSIDKVFTYADSVQDGIDKIKEVVSLLLYDVSKYPEFNLIEDDKLGDNEFVIYISIYLPFEFSKIKEVYKNKMVTLPVWLEHLVKMKNINFSRVLQEGLKKELGIN